MARKNQGLVASRKLPQQARARHTVEAIFEAAARIIEREGPAALNTNRIAERAGVSIGTLYDYFPNKEALLIAMARRQLEEDHQVFRTALAAALDTPGLSPARIAVRALIDLHRSRPEVRRAVMTTHISHGFGCEHARPVQDVAEMIAAHDGERPRLSEAALFVLTRAVIGVVRAAFDERSPLFGTPALEDELTRLIDWSLGWAQTEPTLAQTQPGK
jgi:AcrR family transcriptional regulator